MNIYINPNQGVEHEFNIKETDILVVITSIIRVSDHQLWVSGSQNGKRSNLSTKERYENVLDQLDSIRKFIPQSKLFLLEASLYLTEEELKTLSEKCDHLLHYNDKEDKDYYYYCHSNNVNKGLGEIYINIRFLKLIKNLSFKTMIKLSGRYKIVEGFNQENFTKDVPTVRYIPEGNPLGKVAFTNLYSIPCKYIKSFLEHSKLWLSYTTREAAEYVLTTYTVSIPMVHIVDKLYIEGIGALKTENGNDRILNKL